jgi:hypothetical protein
MMAKVAAILAWFERYAPGSDSRSAAAEEGQADG